MREPSPTEGRASRANPHPSPHKKGRARSRVALFREREDANASAARLRRIGFSVVCLPVIEIRTTPVQPRQSRYDAVVATSDKAFHDRRAIRHVVAALCRRRPHRTCGRGARLAAGLAADADADELVRTLAGALKPGASVLYLAGRDRKEVIEAALAERFSLKSSKPTRRRRAKARFAREPSPQPLSLGEGKIEPEVALFRERRMQRRAPRGGAHLAFPSFAFP